MVKIHLLLLNITAVVMEEKRFIFQSHQSQFYLSTIKAQLYSSTAAKKVYANSVSMQLITQTLQYILNKSNLFLIIMQRQFYFKISVKIFLLPPNCNILNLQNIDSYVLASVKSLYRRHE